VDTTANYLHVSYPAEFTSRLIEQVFVDLEFSDTHIDKFAQALISFEIPSSRPTATDDDF